MVYVPPVKKRQYVNAIRDRETGKVISHACSRCHTGYAVKIKGIWFTRADVNDVWVWLCEACCRKNGMWFP